MQKIYNILEKDEIDYLESLISDKGKWLYQSNFRDSRQFYNSLKIDVNKLKNYYNILTQNGVYEISETALNVITIDTQIKNKHTDECDLSYVTYINDGFTGGDFIYYENQNNFKIKPEIGLTIEINQGISHEVEKITEGVRFSLYTFLIKKQKKNNTLL
jgi:hypothetical protein